MCDGGVIIKVKYGCFSLFVQIYGTAKGNFCFLYFRALSNFNLIISFINHACFSCWRWLLKLFKSLFTNNLIAFKYYSKILSRAYFEKKTLTLLYELIYYLLNYNTLFYYNLNLLIKLKLLGTQ